MDPPLVPERELPFPGQFSGAMHSLLLFHGRSARWCRIRTASWVRGCGTGTAKTRHTVP